MKYSEPTRKLLMILEFPAEVKPKNINQPIFIRSNISAVIRIVLLGFSPTA